jgi:hypothetical protein
MPSIAEELPLPPPKTEWGPLLARLPLFPPPTHPPASLYPLLAPLLRQKLGILSLGRGRSWPRTLTWLPSELSHKVVERLRSPGQESTGLGEEFLGYRRFDEETVIEPNLIFPLT